MKTVFHEKSRKDIKFWFDYANGKYHYWKKIDGGISYTVTERQYNNLLKKYEQQNEQQAASRGTINHY